MNLALGMLKFIICSGVGLLAGFGVSWCVGLLPFPLPQLAGLVAFLVVSLLLLVTWEKIAEGWGGKP